MSFTDLAQQYKLGTGQSGHKVKGGWAGKNRGWVTVFEGVGHRKLSAIIRVGHIKICRNFFKGMCIKIHVIQVEINPHDRGPSCGICSELVRRTE